MMVGIIVHSTTFLSRYTCRFCQLRDWHQGECLDAVLLHWCWYCGLGGACSQEAPVLKMSFPLCHGGELEPKRGLTMLIQSLNPLRSAASSAALAGSLLPVRPR